RRLYGVLHVEIELIFVRDNFHRTSAQHKRWPDQDGIADLFGDGAGVFQVSRNAVGGLFELEPLDESAEFFAIPSGLDGIHGGAEDGDAGFFEPAGEVERRLAAELDDDAFDVAADLVPPSQSLSLVRVSINSILRITGGIVNPCAQLPIGTQ